MGARELSLAGLLLRLRFLERLRPATAIYTAPIIVTAARGLKNAVSDFTSL